MTISMYSASVPVFKNMLGNLSHLLDQAQAHADHQLDQRHASRG